MMQELRSKANFDQARAYAFDYIDGIEAMDVFPSAVNLEKLRNFDEPLAERATPAENIIEQLHTYGSPATVAQTGGRYFGFVNGGAVPAALGAKWLADVWDQCGGLFNTSPVNAQLEVVCERWLKDIFKLSEETVAGFVSGTSTANLCALAAARYQLLQNLGWDINQRGLNGAPALRVIAHEQTHASVKRTLALLGYGFDNVEWVPSDEQGRLRLEELPTLDSTCLVLLQAGNANTGSYDNFDQVCDLAKQVGAWVHIDGAFGLWAAASSSLSHLTEGIEKADSWAVDGHKTLNAPYDSGIVLCRHPQALIPAMQASGEYLVYSEQRDPILYTTEMSKRSRAIELWATMKYLGKSGIDELVTTFHTRARQLEQGLRSSGFRIVNEVVFNQVLIATEDEHKTKQVIEYIQQSGECWLGGSTWRGEAVIRVSICSWVTSADDIERTVELFKKARAKVYAHELS